MTAFVRWLSIATCTAWLMGCAHPITMAPDLAAVSASSAPRVNSTAALHITDTAKALEVTSAGGGGDKVRYFPYKDLEPGLYKALSEVFANVTTIKMPQDAASLKVSGPVLVIKPEISTYSYSDSLLTWPPTKFGVTLTCTVTDTQGALIDTIKVTGDGFAPFEEFKSNFSLSAVRASTDVLNKLVQALSNSAALRR
jgi:hypothetical protein